jgi:hypothetical protein
VRNTKNSGVAADCVKITRFQNTDLTTFSAALELARSILSWDGGFANIDGCVVMAFRLTLAINLVCRSMSDSFQNPFAIPAAKRRNPLVSSLKGLGFVAVLLVLVVVLQSQTRQWLLNQWASGFAELPVGEQIERLLQINQLGDLATETLALRIAAENDSVAETAVDLIRDRQTAWSTRKDDDLAAAHMRMLVGLEKIVDQLPTTRIGWVTELVNQTLIECVDQRGPEMTQTYRAANELLTRVADRTGLQNESDPSLAGPSLVPLPVRMQAIDEATEVAAVPLPAPEPTAPVIASPETAGPKLVARSTAPVATAKRPEQAIHHVANDNDQALDQADANGRRIDKTPLQTFSTRSVIGLLASNQAATRDQAVEELVRRGLSNEEIRIANQLAAPQVDVRLGLLDSIVRRSDLDPRPWLLWLAEDTNREVRIRAVTALQAMNDTAVTSTLRKRLSVEDDPTVIALLRQLTERR